MESADWKMKDLIDSLYKYEWTVIENAQNIKDMRKNGMELDEVSFEVAFRQTKRFMRMLESVNSDLNRMRRKFEDIDAFDNQCLGDVRE
jgi:hypothetical protein